MRAVANGLIGVLAGIYLAELGCDPAAWGAVAWYNVIQDVGHALGAALAVLPPFLREFAGVNPLDSLRAAMILYALLYAATAVLYLGLTSQAEAPTAALRVEVSPQSRSILAKMSLLFALDSFAGGFQGSALFAYFFHAQFGAS